MNNEKSQHTPGPWSVEHDHIVARNSDGFSLARLDSIAKVFPDSVPLDENTKANARLIAAAPELLEALKTIKEACKDVLITSINEALKQGFKMETWTAEQMQWASAVEMVEAAISKVEGKS